MRALTTRRTRTRPGRTGRLGALVAATAVLLAPIGLSGATANAAPAASNVPPVTFQAGGSGLWILENGGGGPIGPAIRPGTSPAISRVSNGTSYQTAFQNSAGNLQLIGGLDNTQSVAMAPGTSPAITEIAPPSSPEGQFLRSRYMVAVQNQAGQLQTIGAFRPANFGLGMAAGTSPSIATLGNGNDNLPRYVVAMQANTGSLITAVMGGNGAIAARDWGLGMAPGTSPAIVGTGLGSFAIAFQANTGTLFTVSSNGAIRNWGLGMAGGTSPSISTVTGDGQGAQIAFQSDAGGLWSVGDAGNLNWQLGMQPGTSPSIGRLPGGGYQIAFQSNGGELWTVGAAGNQNWGLGMGRDSSPAIATSL